MKKNLLFIKAFEYAVRGYSVIPLRKNKLPLLGSWKQYQKAPATEIQLESWWKKHPDANIGILTGKISGVTVVDIDTSQGKQVSFDAFPKTFTVKTPTGGYHLYYAYDGRIQQTANTFPQFPHVDIRNDGGYVVAPPSEADYVKEKKRVTGAYKVERALPIVPFPYELFHNQRPVEKNSARGGAAKILKDFKGMEEGDGRNVALAKAIGLVLRVVPDADRDTTGRELAEALNARFKKPLPGKEVKTTFDSILKKERSKPLSKIDFLRNHEGDIIVNEENIYRTIEADPALSGCFRTNTFAGTLECRFENDKWEPMQRVDIVSVQMYLQRTFPYFARVSAGDVESAIIRYMRGNQVSPPAEWIAGLVWDEKPRLDSWLSKVYGAPEDAYHSAVASNWMKGLVKRVLQPGCKFDYVLVLEGRQGMKKSMSLAVLGGVWHTETVFAPDNKDFFMIFADNMIVEFSEGETLSRTEAKRLKAVITMQHDKYRPPYERSAKDFPRQCVFAMTTNQDQYLKDETGNRRWLPVAVEQIADVEWLTKNRDQLFAEAAYRVGQLKETTWEFPEEETRAAQLSRQQTDPREEQIHHWYFNILTQEQRELGITTRQAYVNGIQGLDGVSGAFGREMGRMEEMVVAGILKEGLYMLKKRTMESGQRYYKYYASADTLKIAPPTVEDIAAGKTAGIKF
jgi:hypothetical protein